MKLRISVMILLAMMTVVDSMAQISRVRDSEYFPRSEIYLQYGTPSVVELATKLNSRFSSEGYRGDSRNQKFSGIAAVGYNFFVHPRVSVGLDFGYGYGSADMYITDSESMPLEAPIFVCRSTVNSYSAHVSASYTYWQQGPMECSGSLYLGVTYQDESIVRGNEDYFIPEANDRLRFYPGILLEESEQAGVYLVADLAEILFPVLEPAGVHVYYQ